MTNLEIIKYLALNTPARLAEFLDDIYWAGRLRDKKIAMGHSSTNEIDDFDEWLHQDATNQHFFLDCELRKWSKIITKEN